MKKKNVLFTTTCCCCWLPQWFGLESAHLFMSIDTDSWYITWLCSCPLLTLYFSSLPFCFFIFCKHCVEVILKLRKCVSFFVCDNGVSGKWNCKEEGNVALSKGFGIASFWEMGALSLLFSWNCLCLWGMFNFLQGVNNLFGLFFIVKSRYLAE
jgi:hypothetical protein